MNQFEIELPVNSSGLGSQKLLFLAKMDQFEIELSVNSSGLGVPKTVHFENLSPSQAIRAPALQSVI